MLGRIFGTTFKNVFAFDLERLRNADLKNVHWMSTYSVNSCHYLNSII